MKHTTRASALALAGVLVLSACGDAPDADNGDSGDETAAESEGKACMISDFGGFDDGSFNETSLAGMERASEEFGVEVQTLESASETDYEPNMQTFLQQGDCDIIVSVGFALAEVTFAAAEAEPDQLFGIVDFPNEDELPNVLGLTFETGGAAFLAGYAAAATTESGVLGTYGGQPFPTVTVFMDGFLAGAQHFNDETGGDVEVIGWDGAEGQFTGNFESLDDGRRITENLLDNGADTILPVAGPVGGGSGAALQDRGEGRLIWVDTDGYEVAANSAFQDLIFTSVEKRMDDAVFLAVEAVVNDAFEGGNYVGTLENEGVGIAPFHDFDDEVDDELRSTLEELREQIIAGELDVAPQM